MPFLLGLPANSTGTGTNQGALGLDANYAAANPEAQNTTMIFPKQLYVRFDGLSGNKAHTLQIGRFEFLDGSEVVPQTATVSPGPRQYPFCKVLLQTGHTNRISSARAVPGRIIFTCLWVGQEGM